MVAHIKQEHVIPQQEYEQQQEQVQQQQVQELHQVAVVQEQQQQHQEHRVAYRCQLCNSLHDSLGSLGEHQQRSHGLFPGLQDDQERENVLRIIQVRKRQNFPNVFLIFLLFFRRLVSQPVSSR